MAPKASATEILTKAKTAPDVIEMPARRALAIDGVGSPQSEAFRRSLQALYGITYTIKFARKKGDGRDFKVLPLEGDWSVQNADSPVADQRDRWRWRLRIMVPDDITPAELRSAVAVTTTKKGGKLFESVEATRVFLERLPRRRYGRILHVGPYAAEPASVAALEGLLADRGLQRQPWHTEVYLSDPSRTPAEKLRTTLLVELHGAAAKPDAREARGTVARP